MKHTFTLLFLAIFFLAVSLKAQSQFNKLVYDQPYSSLHSDIALLSVDGGILDFGRTYASPFILKLDAAGNVKWSKSYSFDTSPSFSFLNACTSHDSTYAAVGLTYSVNPYINPVAFCVKFKANGDTLWCRKLSKAGWSTVRPYSISPTIDSGFVISGHGLGANSYEAFILKLSKNGTLNWMKTLNTYGAFSFSAKQTADSGYVMTGQVNGCVGLSKFDKNGNLSWNKNYCEKSGGNSSVGYDILVEKQGYVIAAGTNSDVAAVIKTDFSGNIILAKSFSYSTMYSGTGLPGLQPVSLKKNRDNGYLFVYNGGDFGSGFCLKTDSLLDCKWKSTDYYTMIQMEELKNKSYMLIGNQPDITVKSTGSNSIKYGVLPIVVRDSLGVNTSTCVYSYTASASTHAFSVTVVNSTLSSGGLSSPLQPTLAILGLMSENGCYGIPGGLSEFEKNPLKLFPNPSAGVFSIRSDVYFKHVKLSVHDLTGRTVFERTLNHDDMEKIDISSLQSGIYIYSLTEDSRPLRSGKLIITK